MKKLLFLTFLLPLFSEAQTIPGVNSEHQVSQQQKPFHEPHDLEVKKITLSTGVELEYVEKGKPGGTPVIFLHGLSDSWHSFETVLGFLPDHIHAFSLTQRGHGDSKKPAKGYRPKDFAADVAAFIRQKNLGKVILAGHSMGGVNAQQFALTYPSLLKALVIIGSDPCFRKIPGMKEFQQESRKLEGRPMDRQFIVDFQKSTIARPIDSVYFDVLVDEAMKPTVSVFNQALDGLMEVDFVPQLHKITQPVLITWGDKDAFCYKQGQDLFMKHLKHAKQIIYRETGHSLHWEKPQQFANDLAAFVASVEGRP